MTDPYDGRDQTATKHYVLRKYLQTLAYKILQGPFSSLTYVDAFSGPWKNKTEDFSDTSFMIALTELKSVHNQLNKGKVIRCFFVEENKTSFKKLQNSVLRFHAPEQQFIVRVFNGTFEEAIPEIKAFVSDSFALTFIDPTGWTGYGLKQIAPILSHAPGEVLINFMYDFIQRFTNWDDPRNIATFDAILGGPGWRDRLDPRLSRGEAVELLFRNELKKHGGFRFVLSTPILKISDRPHFSLAYGTRSNAGLEAFRDIERAALQMHEQRRRKAKEKERVERTGQHSLFPAEEGPSQLEQAFKAEADAMRDWIRFFLRDRSRPILFKHLWPMALERFMVRKTDVKDACVDLAKQGLLVETWKDGGARRRKPGDESSIELARDIR